MLGSLRIYLLLGAAIAALIGGLWIVHTLKDQGRAEVRSQIETHNQEGSNAARKARDDHDLACARGEPGCLSDPWTRDGGR